jgi:hypothetical protein
MISFSRLILQLIIRCNGYISLIEDIAAPLLSRFGAETCALVKNALTYRTQKQDGL